MTVTPITLGQEKQIIRLAADTAESAAKNALFQLKLSSDGAQRAIESGDQLKTAIEATVTTTLRRLASPLPTLVETELLKPVTQTIVPTRTKPFNAAEFYQTGPGLYVSRTFADRLDMSVRQSMVPAHSGLGRPYVASLLKANAYDKDIREELPKEHLSTFEDIAGLIEAQPGGSPGFLLNNGYANICYFEDKNGEVFAVGVAWDSAHREWHVHDWKLDELGYWFADCQVLCPGNAAL
jgi:hypothetical protein